MTLDAVYFHSFVAFVSFNPTSPLWKCSMPKLPGIRRKVNEIPRKKWIWTTQTMPSILDNVQKNIHTIIMRVVDFQWLLYRLLLFRLKTAKIVWITSNIHSHTIQSRIYKVEHIEVGSMRFLLTVSRCVLSVCITTEFITLNAI